MLYHYDGSFDGLMTAVYDAFYARIPVDQAHFLAATDATGTKAALGATGVAAAGATAPTMSTSATSASAGSSTGTLGGGSACAFGGNATGAFCGMAEAEVAVPMTFWDSDASVSSPSAASQQSATGHAAAGYTTSRQCAAGHDAAGYAASMQQPAAGCDAAGHAAQVHPDIREITVQTSGVKARKVIRALVAQVSYDAYTCCYHAHLSCYPNRGDLIFQYIKLCFGAGPGVMQMWGHPVAGEVMRMARRVTRENQHMLGFLRFQELDSGALFAEISPTNNLLELMAPHFADRLSGENWLIYDSARNIACVHRPGQDVLFTDQIPPELLALKEHSAAEPMYQDLWRAFFKAIAIEGRYNPKCQQNLMPKKYWKHMTEMQSQSN